MSPVMSTLIPTGESPITVSLPATTMRAQEKAVEQWGKDVEKWEKEMVRYDKEWWNKLENKALGSLCATTTTAIQPVLEDNITARGAGDAIQQRFGQHPEITKLELPFDQLRESDVELPDLIKAMLLLSCVGYALPGGKV
ncbi:hypothetical protein PQX77_016790 [Marasmius sp. AFHP31]|nr:hypothetical protein PQX77_016790 [Marasmius sp. AFHP31]